MDTKVDCWEQNKESGDDFRIGKENNGRGGAGTPSCRVVRNKENNGAGRGRNRVDDRHPTNDGRAPGGRQQEEQTHPGLACSTLFPLRFCFSLRLD